MASDDSRESVPKQYGLESARELGTATLATAGRLDGKRKYSPAAA